MTSKSRMTVNLPCDEYAELSALAKKHRVSMAWLGRQAISEFLERYSKEELQLPLALSSSKKAAGDE
jgi:predicted transcriptional regulator